MTGQCGACHRARIRATRWHRRENAAPRPGHERICSRRRLVICPTGKSVNWLSSPFCKNISIPAPPKSLLELLASHPTRGAYRDRHGRAVRMRWTRQRLARNGSAQNQMTPRATSPVTPVKLNLQAIILPACGDHGCVRIIRAGISQAR
jgi:hypothetical protein